jgi:nucleotide-binding universal stress UspA family protein
MSFKRILLPVDGSDYSDLATDKAVELAKLADSVITVFFVRDRAGFVQPITGATATDADALLSAEEKNIVGSTEEKIKRARVQCTVRIGEGNPGREICGISDLYDIIVMGTAGRSGIRKVLMGSVTQYAIEHASCPVMAVKIRSE